MANVISNVFDEVGPEKKIGFCSDNATNMKKAWDLLEIKYANYPIVYYSCAAHTLNLISSDLLKLIKNLNEDSVSIVKTVNRKSVLRATFKEIQASRDGSKITLKLPIIT